MFNKMFFAQNVRNLLTIGDAWQGGIIGYLLLPGDTGYDANVQHGLIAAASDQGTFYWHVTITGTTGATATAIGAGNANTNLIIALYGTESNAARTCYDLSLNGYSDWYLPNKDELNQLYINRVAVGGFGTYNYWSSSEANSALAWNQLFMNGNQVYSNKDDKIYVRAIRSF